MRRHQMVAMSGLLEDLKAAVASATGSSYTSEEIACLNQANGSPKVKLIDQQIETLARSWQPTGYYRPADVAQLLATFATETAAAGAALAEAPMSTSDAADVKRMTFADAGRRYQDPAKVYAKAVADAQAKGANVIDAPGLKDWVIASMRTISDLYVTATVLQCRQSWLEKWLDKAYQAMATIGAVAMRMVGVVVKIGDNIVKAVDWTAQLIKYAPFAALGVGAYFLYQQYKER